MTNQIASSSGILKKAKILNYLDNGNNCSLIRLYITITSAIITKLLHNQVNLTSKTCETNTTKVESFGKEARPFPIVSVLLSSLLRANFLNRLFVA